jgi:Lactonase, 7-bladed beta-propeller/FG-GAP repeat
MHSYRGVTSQDVVATAPSAYKGGSAFEVFFGNSDGSFAPGVTSTGLPSQSPLVAAAHNAKRVYVAGQNSVASFSLAPNGAATLINSVAVASGNFIAYLAVDASGDWLLASDLGAAVIRTHRINQTTGSLGPVEQSLNVGSGPGGLAMNPDNLHLVAAKPYAPALGVFSFNPTTGEVASTTEFAATQGGLPLVAVIADFDIPGFPFGYVVSEYNSNTLTIFAGDATGPTVKHSTIAAGAGSPFNCANPYSMAASDLNGDGKVDLVVGCVGYGNKDHPVVVLMNNGGAVFSAFYM